jgi:multiple sugar transport system substrate-binding protein
LLGPGEWMDLADDSAGPSFCSYIYEDMLLALPIDAAAPAASMRSDLLADAGHSAPANWNELLELSRNGLVRMPGFPADLFLNLMGLCITQGGEIAIGGDSLFDRSIAIEALGRLRELASWMPEEIYHWNPVTLYEKMASKDEFAYCPFAYTYSNYARSGFAANRISFADTVALDGVPMRTVMGGTGLAISRSCAIPDIALKYALYVSGRSCQSTLYGVCGGQPARRSAWKSDELNRLTDGFFHKLLPNIERAYVRPRYDGYVSLQEQAGIPIIKYLRAGGDAGQALDDIDELFRASVALRTRHA